jgi:hypothetical protein
LTHKAQHDPQADNLYIKIAVGCLIPYHDNSLMSLSPESMSILTKIFDNKANVYAIKASLLTISDKEALLAFILDFYKDKIIKEKSFFDLLSILCINYKGLSMDEIIRIVR